MVESPIEMLFVIVGHKNLEKVNNILSENQIEYKAVIPGKGTAESKIGDLFGFGIIDRDIVTTMIKTEQRSTILQQLDDALNLSKPHVGVAFSISIDAISSDVLQILNFSLGDKLWLKQKVLNSKLMVQLKWLLP